ncbi:MAG: tetratricopeptide repeat protein [Bacteroidetes bacterium]|nr:tetratricopeptide repeat protein [Bacteroidota bacterium]
MLACHTPEGGGTAQHHEVKDTLLYLNHADSAHYVGIQTCALCHQDIYQTFINTGMGRSFDVASRSKSAADFSQHVIYDSFSDMHYSASWSHDSLQITEFRLDKRDTVFSRTETVNYIIGSGQHTNSHIQRVNGYLNQMPMTFYTQKKQWDLPPGFENGMNSHFNRKIGLECMSCHNAYPDFVLGSENKFNAVPQGINCERCHGPGSIHVAQRSTGSKIDTSRYIDYSIVNPAKLPVDLQFDICQRCHLQGNSILKEGKSFYDFKPGMKLSNYMTVFLPKYAHADDEFIMASHADRLKQSQCFIRSYEKASKSTALKPYKEALTCVTCHNPHVSVRETNKEVFNDACRKCHSTGGASTLSCSDKNVVAASHAKQGHAQANLMNCVSCHMPKSGSIDIPHVTVHDHYIRKPVNAQEKQALKTFIGLYAINEKNPDKLTKARAYLNQYEKFDMKAMYLDSARALLSDKKQDLDKTICLLVQWAFCKQDYAKVIQYAGQFGEDALYKDYLQKKSYDNAHAWTAYRIGESYNGTGNAAAALRWFQKAVELAPYYMEFRNKLATCYAMNNRLADAEKEYLALLKEYPKHVSALTNMGYMKFTQHKLIECEQYYNRALKLDPDYVPLLMKCVDLYIVKQQYAEASKVLTHMIKLDPGNQAARMMLGKLNTKG